MMICCLIILYTFFLNSTAKPQRLSELDLLNKPHSLERIIKAAVHIVVRNATTQVEGITVYYLEANPSVNKKPGVDLLYLHGAAFSSHDWNRDEPSIIQMSAASGYRSVAIDIPGFSYSRSRGPSVRDYGKFLASLVEVLSIHKPVIISASASGSYSVPYVFQNQDKITGFVPVGICCTQNKNWETFSVPTLIIYGSQDRASISRKLLNIPNKNLVIIADAPHAAYIRKPLDFMTALINFMNYIHPKHDSNLLNTIFTAKIYA